MIEALSRESGDVVVITSVGEVSGGLTLKEMEQKLLRAQEIKV